MHVFDGKKTEFQFCCFPYFRVLSSYLEYESGWQIWTYLLKLTPPMENRTVTQAVKHTVAITSHSPGLLSKNGFPSIIPAKNKIE